VVAQTVWLLGQWSEGQTSRLNRRLVNAGLGSPGAGGRVLCDGISRLGVLWFDTPDSWFADCITVVTPHRMTAGRRIRCMAGP
jgi:hypothetical protein